MFFPEFIVPDEIKMLVKTIVGLSLFSTQATIGRCLIAENSGVETIFFILVFDKKDFGTQPAQSLTKPGYFLLIGSSEICPDFSLGFQSFFEYISIFTQLF